MFRIFWKLLCICFEVFSLCFNFAGSNQVCDMTLVPGIRVCCFWSSPSQAIALNDSKWQFSFMNVCVLVGTFALVFQAGDIHMTNQVFNQIGQIGNLDIWLPHRPHRSPPREAVGWDRFGVGRVRNLWMSAILNLSHSPKQGPSSNQNNRWMCLTWLTGVLMVHSRVKQIHNLALARIKSAQNVYQVNFTWHFHHLPIVICNLFLALRAVGWFWNGIMQVSVGPNKFLGQPCSHNDEANPRQPPCSDFSDFARWWPARSKGVHRIPDLSQHTARSPWVSAGTPRRWQGIASPTRGWNYAHQERWHSSRGTPRVQEIARQRCNRQMGSDENWFSCLAEDSVRTSIA